MTYKYAVLKTINGKLCVEVNENEKPEFECSNHTFEGKMYQGRVLNEWLQSCKYLDFASDDELEKIKQQVSFSIIYSGNFDELTPNEILEKGFDVYSIITIKRQMCDNCEGQCYRSSCPDSIEKVYFKGNVINEDEIWNDLFCVIHGSLPGGHWFPEKLQKLKSKFTITLK